MEPERRLVVVPHSHWDREWYRTHEQFRHRLLRLLDGVLDVLESNPRFRHFTLDGQTIVLDDYLEVRPHARERIARLVRDGRLLMGPWYVLPDEWLVSGEALIRNLRRGIAGASAVAGNEAAMAVGYVPDQFGHVGQLPQIFAGFGFAGAVLWRGVGADVDQTTFDWEAPDGSRIFTVYLPQGYGNAAGLGGPAEPLARRVRSIIEAQKTFARIPSLLLMNGEDHALVNPELPEALEALASELPGLDLEIGTLPGFVERAKKESASTRPLHRGELRSGLRAPLLPGCASARSHQKQRDFENDRLLTRYLEPLSAWLSLLGGRADVDVIEHCWEVALQNHPHDSICGCSIDPVHEQMETRFRQVEELASAELERVGREILERVHVPRRRFGRSTGAPLVVWNPHAGGIRQVETVLDLPPPLSGSWRPGRLPRLHLRDAQGRRLPVQIESIEPGEIAARQRLPFAAFRLMVKALSREISGQFVHAVHWEILERRVHLHALIGRLPGALDLEALRASAEELLAREDLDEVVLEARRLPRVRLRFVDRLPGHGLRVYRFARGSAQVEDAPSAEATAYGGAAIANEFWRVEVSPAGSVNLARPGEGLRFEDAVRVVSEGDRGDEYNFDPVPGGEVVDRPTKVRVRLGSRSEAEVSIRIESVYRVPAQLDEGRSKRGDRELDLPVTLELRLARGLDRVDVTVEVDNTARDHRLRLHVRAPFDARRFQVESAFEIVERPIHPAPGDFGSEMPAEFPIGACPQRGFASIDDGESRLSVANRGVAEVEAVREPGGSSIAVTLLRAVGWLSRDDLALRPASAGPMIETPGAQVPGAQRAELSILWHRVDDPVWVSAAHGFCAPPLAIAGVDGSGGRGARGALEDGSRLLEVEDPRVVVSAIEPRRSGGPVVRLYNTTGESLRVSLRPNSEPPVALLDLREQPLPVAATGSEIALGPWQIVTVRLN